MTSTARRDPYRPASADSVDQLARELATLRRSTRRPQLTHSAIDDGQLVTTVAGQTTTIIGQQWDGTSGAVVIAGPTPPTPSAPGVTTQPNGITVRWDGTFPDQAGFQLPVVAPGDFKGVEVQVSPDPAFPQGDTADAFDLVVGTLITSARGGDVFVPWGDGGTPLYARLVARAESGKGSAPSAVTGPVSSGVSDDNIAPKAPTSLTLSPGTTMGKDGHEQGYIIAQWVAPTENENNTPLSDLAGHLVHWRPASGTVWQSTITTEESINLTAVPNQSHQVRVSSFDQRNNFSPWTATSSVTVVADVTPPAQPSVPVVGNYLGQLKIFWDGLLTGGTAPPVDFNRVDVHVSGTSGFTPVTGTLVSSLSTRGYAFATNPYGVDAYVKFIAYDNSGNASTVSAQAVGTTSQVVDRDIFDGAVGTSKLADLVVTNAKINLLAVNDANIGNLNVGKLVSGTMSASVVLSGRFTTASTGARVEHNALGFQGFRSDNSKWLSLTNTEALITATIMTATSGRRMVMGASGSVGTLDFYAPDGKRGFIQGLTERSGVESLQIGLDATRGTNYLWNSININSIGITSYQAYKHIISCAQDADAGAVNPAEFAIEFFPNKLTYNPLNPVAHGGVRRFTILSDGTRFRDSADRLTADFLLGVHRFYPGGESGGAIQFIDNQGNTTNSARIKLQQMNGAELGVLVKAVSGFFETRNYGDTGFAPIRASAFEVNSDERSKTAIANTALNGLAMVKAMKIRDYKTKLPRNGGKEVDVDQIGLVAQEARDAGIPVVTGEGSGGALGIDLYQYVSVLAKAVQELATEIESLKRPGTVKP